MNKKKIIKRLEEVIEFLELDLNDRFEDGVRIGLERAIMEIENYHRKKNKNG